MICTNSYRYECGFETGFGTLISGCYSILLVCYFTPFPYSANKAILVLPLSLLLPLWTVLWIRTVRIIPEPDSILKVIPDPAPGLRTSKKWRVFSVPVSQTGGFIITKLFWIIKIMKDVPYLNTYKNKITERSDLVPVRYLTDLELDAEKYSGSEKYKKFGSTAPLYKRSMREYLGIYCSLYWYPSLGGQFVPCKICFYAFWWENFTSKVTPLPPFRKKVKLNAFLQLEEIDSSGKRDLVIKRLKQFYKAKLLKEAGLTDNSSYR